jgi:hypothetical protein
MKGPLLQWPEEWALVTVEGWNTKTRWSLCHDGRNQFRSESFPAPPTRAELDRYLDSEWRNMTVGGDRLVDGEVCHKTWKKVFGTAAWRDDWW